MTNRKQEFGNDVKGRLFFYAFGVLTDEALTLPQTFSTVANYVKKNLLGGELGEKFSPNTFSTALFPRKYLHFCALKVGAVHFSDTLLAVYVTLPCHILKSLSIFTASESQILQGASCLCFFFSPRTDETFLVM